MFAEKNTPATQTQNNSFEKAKAFLNVSVKMADGRTKQIGGIALKESVELHKAIIEHGLEGLVLELDMHVVEASGEIKFAEAS